MTQPILTTLLSFTGTNGSKPHSNLIADAAGNLYGTTSEGGIAGWGTVFELPHGASSVTILATFSYGNGAYPYAGLTTDAAGNFYGTTEKGGSAGWGTIFELTYGTSSVTTLATFNYTNGAYVVAGLTADAAGNLYGATQGGGGANAGTIFELAHSASSVTTLATFAFNNGAGPSAALTADAAGNLYGTTEEGGSAGHGTVFELIHSASPLTTLVTFGITENGRPFGGVTADAAGNLYGTTAYGGDAGDGTVFELAHGASSVTTLATFNGLDGANPTSGLIADAEGNLYGLTFAGGSAGHGTVFKLVHGASSVTTLATFTSASDSWPLAGLTADAAGNLYGTTSSGGSAGDGTVFEITNSGFVAVSAPSVVLASAPSANNVNMATLGITTSKVAGDALLVTLTSDADFVTGSTLTLTNGHLVYRPGLVTAAKVGSDTLTYTVTDTMTGAVTTETQAVTLDNGPPPVIALASAPAATNASPAILAAAAGFGNDALSVALVSDADFATGSKVELLFGNLVYTPGLVTATKAATPDTISYTVTDTVTGAVTIETQAVALSPATLTTLVTFTGPNGAVSFSGLTADTAGNLYGVTTGGGSADRGTVFELARGASSVTTLASFDVTNNAYPYPAPIIDAAGNLYGTTQHGGSADGGTVFELAHGASSVTTLATFTGANGYDVYAGLTADAADNLYGTTFAGGSAFQGTVFELAHGASSVTTLASFDNTIGFHPFAGLTIDAAGNLYGTTQAGGSANWGTVFELAHGASSVTTLATFTSTNGANPYASVIADAAGNLYGTTFIGGSADDGTVFELAHGASAVTTLATFTGLNGANPFGSLITDAAGNLFGTTQKGGSYNDGTVFELAHGSSSITTLATFTKANGSEPYAALTADAVGNLYSTTGHGGGSADYGTVFEITNSGFIVPPAPVVTLASASSASNVQTATLGSVTPKIAGDALTVTLNSDARFATGSTLALTNGNLVYTPGLVTASKVGSDTLTYTVTDTVNGAVTTETQAVTLGNGPVPVVTLAGSPAASNASVAILGAAAAGFGNDALSVALVSDADFATGSKVELLLGNLVYTPGLVTAAKAATPDTISYTVTDTVTGAVTTETQTVGLSPVSLTILATFDSTTGRNPESGLLTDAAGNLYGTTFSAGGSSPGTVFELAAGAHTVSTLASLPHGIYNSYAGVVADAAGNLYGTTPQGGTGDAGTLFELSAGAHAYSTLANFADAGEANPNGLLADAAGNLYGVTAFGGSNGNGAIFKLAAGTHVLSTLASFNGTNGRLPIGSLITDAAGNLYGTTKNGGASDLGTVFELAAGTHGVTTLASFAGLNGSQPEAGLTADAAGNLYGETIFGGVSGYGAVFELATGTHAFSLLASFDSTNGATPDGGLIVDAAGALYGTTINGGDSAHGTAFKIAAGSHAIQTLLSFDGVNGNGPVSALLADATGNLYGTTSGGGPNGFGTVFELSNTGFIVKPLITLGAGVQKVTVSAADNYLGGGGADEFVVNAATIKTTIDGGPSGKNSLTVTGGGTVTMGANITDIATVRLVAGAATPAYNFTANDLPGLIIVGSTGPDTIHDGAGGDTVYVNSATATVFGGGGNDTFYVNAATIGATLDGGAGHSSLGVKDGGTETMGTSITRMAEVHLMGGTPGAAGFDFTANATANLIIVGSKGNDTIHVGDASQTVYTLGQDSRVLATAATAGAKVQEIGAGNVTTLEIAGGGTATLNGDDGHGLLVVLDAATHLDLGTAAFVTATANTAGSTLVARQYQQTLASLVGGATLVGYSKGSDIFLGSKAGLAGDIITGLTANDKIDVTDLAPLTGVSFTQTSAGQGSLSLGFGRSLTLTGAFNPGHFHVANDGHAGSFVTYG